MPDENVQIRIGAEADTQQAESELEQLAQRVEGLMQRMETSVATAKKNPLIGESDRQEWKSYQQTVEQGLDQLMSRYRMYSNQLEFVQQKQKNLRGAGMEKEAMEWEPEAEELRRKRREMITLDIPGLRKRSGQFTEDAERLGLATPTGAPGDAATDGIVRKVLAAVVSYNLAGHILSVAEQGRGVYRDIAMSAYQVGVPGVRGGKGVDEFGEALAGWTKALNFTKAETLRAAEAYNKLAGQVGDKALGEDLQAMARYSRTFAEDLGQLAGYFGQMQRTGMAQSAGGTPELARMLAQAIREENMGGLASQFREGFGLLAQTMAQRLPSFQEGDAATLLGLQRWMHESGVPGFQGVAGAGRLARLNRMFSVEPEGLAQFRMWTGFQPEATTPMGGNWQTMLAAERFMLDPKLLANVMSRLPQLAGPDSESQKLALFTNLFQRAGFSANETDAFVNAWDKQGPEQAIRKMQEKHPEFLNPEATQQKSEANNVREFLKIAEYTSQQLGKVAENLAQIAARLTGSTLPGGIAGNVAGSLAQSVVSGLIMGGIMRGMGGRTAGGAAGAAAGGAARAGLGAAGRWVGRTAMTGLAEAGAALGAGTVGAAFGASALGTAGLIGATAVGGWYGGRLIGRAWTDKLIDDQWNERERKAIEEHNREAKSTFEGSRANRRSMIVSGIESGDEQFKRDVSGFRSALESGNDLLAEEIWGDFRKAGRTSDLAPVERKLKVKISVEADGKVVVKDVQTEPGSDGGAIDIENLPPDVIGAGGPGRTSEGANAGY